MRDIFIWAHRGASARAPENTMVAFRQAAAAGADGIELDVHLSMDGVPVVIHDDTLERTTSGRGAVARASVKKIRSFDAGAWFDESFRGESVPTLAEVLDWLPSSLRLNIEIKEGAAGLAVIELISAYPAADLVVSSFNHKVLQDLRARDANLPLAFLTDSRFWHGAARKAVACRAIAFHPRQDIVSRPMMDFCRRHGLAVHTWTVDDPGRVRSLARIGVEGVFTNDPANLLEALGLSRRDRDSSPGAVVVE